MKICLRAPAAMRLQALSIATRWKRTVTAPSNTLSPRAPLALMLIDIDHFKSYNDRFGHAAGDKMLKRIVLDIMAAARMSDLTYRFGGEEFVVIADGINAEDALSLGERIRHRIADSHAESADGLTVSVGIASCSRDALDYDTLFEIADKRLYEAKAAGRNRVVGPEKSVRLIQAR